jgi:flagella basal body P-ring formation protein FlgA
MFRCLVAGFLLVFATPVWAGDVVANRTLRVGTILNVGDVSPRTEEGGAIAEAMLGQEVRRAIYAGRVILPTDLGPATLVRRNDVVTMTYTASGLGLRTEGRALAAGGAGEVVNVMNLDSRLTVRAVVVAEGLVEVRR